MAVDFNQNAASANNYAYYTIGNSGSGSSLVAMGDDLSIFCRIRIDEAPGALGDCIAACVNMPPGFGGYNRMGLLLTNDLKVWASAGGTPGSQAAYSATAIPLGQWVAVGCSIHQGSIKAYLEGIPGTENTTAWSGGALEETIIGAHPTVTNGTFNRPYKGCAQNLYLWSAQLTDQNHADLANGADPSSIAGGPDLVISFTNQATADQAILNGSPITLYFKIYNANPSDTTATVDTCATSPDSTPEETGQVDECGAEDEADALQAAIEWPRCALVPQRISVDIITQTMSPGRAFSGHEQIVQPDPGCFRIIFSGVHIATKTQVLQWRDIETSLNGRNGVILVPVYEGKLSDIPIVATSLNDYPIGQTRIDLMQTAGEIITAGMNFSFGERLYRVKRVNSQETGGPINIAITPPLRAAVAIDDAAEFNNPVCRCRLATDDAMNVNLELLRYANPSVEFHEDV